MVSDRQLARRIRSKLPPEVFRPNPLRAMIAVPLVVAIASLSACLATMSLPTCVGIPSAALLGNLYASLFFFGHEAGHGAVSRSRAVQVLLMYLAFAIFCLSPHLWHVWHNRVHHRYTNRVEHDPDNFGDIEAYLRFPSTNAFLKVAPGSGHWLSTIYLPTWFTIHAQGVLWIKSRRLGGFASLNRARAMADSVLMAGT